jgi:hypothetical protein
MHKGIQKFFVMKLDGRNAINHNNLRGGPYRVVCETISPMASGNRDGDGGNLRSRGPKRAPGKPELNHAGQA